MSIWPEVPFSKHYLEPSLNGLTRPRRVRGTGYKMVNMGEIFAHDRIRNPLMELVPMNEREIEKYSLTPGDLLFARQSLVREGAGKVSIVLETPEITTFEGHLIRVRLDTNKANPLFYYYYFSSPTGKANMQTIVMQVAAAGIRGSELAELPVPYPSLVSQNKIAGTMSAYDNLIENNRRRIEILEEMARTIYREWFVHFRFPGHNDIEMVDSELGEIPEGWTASTLEEVLSTLESGSRPRGGIDPNERGVPSIGAENVLGLGQYKYSKEKYVSHEFFERMKRGRVQSGDVLLYKDGAKIGRKSMFRNGFPHEICCINEHVFILRTSDFCSQNYLYFWLDLPELTQRIINLNSNAAQPGINQKSVKSLPILLPDSDIRSHFDSTVEPMLALLFRLASMNNTLSSIRDMLLPRLVGGKIDVSELDLHSPAFNTHQTSKYKENQSTLNQWLDGDEEDGSRK